MNKKDLVYFKIAKNISELSKDKNTKVGCVIIDKYGKVVSMGYNGYPSNFGKTFNLKDENFPYSREKETIELKQNYPHLSINKGKFKENKYPFILHAEQNALLTTSDNSRLQNSTLYCTHYPCSSCAIMLAQSGVKNIKVLDNKHGCFSETIVPTLFVYENMGMSFSIFSENDL